MNIEEYKELKRQRDLLDKQISEIENNYSNAKIFHIDAYVISLSGRGLDSIEDIVDYIDNYTDISLEIASHDERDLLWHDDIDVNKIDCPIETYKKYFEQD